MSYELVIQQRDDYLHFELTGEYDPEKAEKDFGLLLDSCLETGICNVLIDCRNLKNVMEEMLDSYRYISSVTKKYHEYRNRNDLDSLRIAYLFAVSVKLDEQFVHTLTQNFGFPAMATNDMDAALNWLRE